jgi:PilZ domain
MAVPHLPRTSDVVRLQVGGQESLAEVVAVAGEVVTLDTFAPAGPAEIVFSTPRGVVALSGDLDAGRPHPAFVVSGSPRVDQRRSTFRIALGCPMTVTREDGTVLAGTLTDLSTGGALLGDRAEPLALDERVTVVVDAGEHGSATVTGVVVRLDGLRRAVRFEDLSPRAQTVLERFLAAEQRANIRIRPEWEPSE